MTQVETTNNPYEQWKAAEEAQWQQINAEIASAPNAMSAILMIVLLLFPFMCQYTEGEMNAQADVMNSVAKYSDVVNDMSSSFQAAIEKTEPYVDMNGDPGHNDPSQFDLTDTQNAMNDAVNLINDVNNNPAIPQSMKTAVSNTVSNLFPFGYSKNASQQQLENTVLYWTYASIGYNYTCPYGDDPSEMSDDFQTMSMLSDQFTNLQSMFSGVNKQVEVEMKYTTSNLKQFFGMIHDMENDLIKWEEKPNQAMSSAS